MNQLMVMAGEGAPVDILSDAPQPARLSVAIAQREGLRAIRAAWADLSRRAVEQNPYYSPAYALALLETVARNDRVAAVVVWNQERLAALLPFERQRFWLWHVHSLVHVAWLTLYTYSGMPLLDAAQTDVAADALIAGLAAEGHLMWVLPRLNIDGPAIRAITDALDRRGLPWAIAGRFERASFDSTVSFEDHMKHYVGGKRRGELSRYRRRLEEIGKVSYTIVSEGAMLDEAVEAFLRLEQKGWKGERGSALASRPVTLAFARQALTSKEGGGAQCRADVLSLDGKPVAISLTLLSGRTGFTIKSAYDEDFRRYGVGLLLQEFMIRDFLDKKWASRLDSATSGKHVIEGLWPGRIAVGDLTFSLDPRMTKKRFDRLMAIECWRRRMRAKTRQWREAANTGLQSWLAQWDGRANGKIPS